MSVADYTKLVRLADYNQHAVSSSQLASKQMMDADRLAAAEEAGFVCAYFRVSASGFASVRGALCGVVFAYLPFCLHAATCAPAMMTSSTTFVNN